MDREQGWNKADAILEEAAAQKNKEAGEAQKAGQEAAAVIGDPDEQAGAVLDGAAAKEEGAKKG